MSNTDTIGNIQVTSGALPLGATGEQRVAVLMANYLLVNGPLKGQWRELAYAPHGDTFKFVAPAAVSMGTQALLYSDVELPLCEYVMLDYAVSFHGVSTHVRIGVHGPSSTWGDAITDAVFQRDVAREGRR